MRNAFELHETKIVFHGLLFDEHGEPTQERAVVTIRFPSCEQVRRGCVSVLIEQQGQELPLVNKEICGEGILEGIYLAFRLASSLVETAQTSQFED